MISIPERFTYFECYLTLRCNFNCHWCINKYTGVSRNRKELTANEWCLGLNNIESSIPITLGGGEPTLHPEFYEILYGLNPKHKIDILSNGSFDIDEFLEKTTPKMFTEKEPEYKAIRLSYHPGYTNKNEIILKAMVLLKKGYPVGIFGLNHPNNLKANIEMTEQCRVAGVYFFVRDFLGYYQDRLYGYYRYHSALNGNKKTCRCRIQEILIGPNGNVYRCHRDLYEEANSIGNILNMTFKITDEFRPCSNYGLCSPCDVKLKLSNDLITSKCSVEIEET